MANIHIEQNQERELRGTSYLLGKQIAQGAAGAVHEAHHRVLGLPVIVKLLLPEHVARPNIVGRFRAEALILARIGPHPNLVRVMDFGVTESGRPFLVMERLQGRSLSQEIAARGPLPVSEAIDDVLQVLAGLDVAHRAGVVHRDVKLGNLFCCEPDAAGRRVVKVLDFGVAKMLRKLEAAVDVRTEEGAVLGSLAYLSPEQALSLRVDARTDVYGAAVCLYKLVAGRGPFAYTCLVDMVRAHAWEEPLPPSRFAAQPIPEALDDLLPAGARQTPVGPAAERAGVRGGALGPPRDPPPPPARCNGELSLRQAGETRVSPRVRSAPPSHSTSDIAAPPPACGSASTAVKRCKVLASFCLAGTSAGLSRSSARKSPQASSPASWGSCINRIHVPVLAKTTPSASLQRAAWVWPMTTAPAWYFSARRRASFHSASSGSREKYVSPRSPASRRWRPA